MDESQSHAGRKGEVRPGLAWLALTVVIGAIYGGVGGHQFVNFDDPMFLYENNHVRAGLTAEGLRWAWTNKDAVLWQPVAWMGHMLVSALGGMRPAPHLLVNLALHALNAGLLFSVLRVLTGRPGRSFAVALLFAVHPVNVETAAWASQLKSTLSTFFFLLGLLAYAREGEPGGRGRFGVLLAFALSLLAKPMMLFFPVVLALLDFWPLRRLPAAGDRAGWSRWLGGKLPYLILAGVLLGMTLLPWTAPAAADVAPMQAPDWARLRAVPCNYVGYLGLMAWPVDLAVLYPERLDHSTWAVIGSGLLLLAVSAWAWHLRFRIPALLFGWAWFLVTMIPASGLLRAGQHGLADRYLYVPGIGLLVALVWPLADLLAARGRWLRPALLAGAALALGGRAHGQVAYWADSVSLWTHAAAVTPPSAVGYVNLGNALLAAGRDREADAEFVAAIAWEGRDPRPYVNRAVIARRQGDNARAIALLRQALTLAQRDARIYSNLGSLLDDVGDKAEARHLLEQAVQLNPGLVEAQINLGVLLAQAGHLEGARACLEAAARLRPDDPAIKHNLQLVLKQLGPGRRD